MNDPTPILSDEEQLEEITAMIVALARLDFSVVAKKRGAGPLDAVIVGLQTLAEELQANIAAKEKAESTSLAKSVFLANVSHELRTPLTTLRGSAELISKEPLDDKLSGLVGNILHSTKVLTRLINDLLDASKIAEGSFRIENRSFHLSEMLRTLVESHSLHTESKGLVLKENFKAIPERPLSGDRERIEQVLHNLLTNALKFTEEGWVAFKVRAEVKDGGGGILAHFSVADSGIGISNAERESIFERSPAKPMSQNVNAAGHGLGLNIASSLVRELGGELKLESELGAGSAFSFSLPLEFAPAEELKWPTKKASSSRRRILVVDDDELVRMTIKAMLNELEYRVVSVSSGLDALETTKREDFDLILMDCQMPSLDGLETTRRLLKQHPTRKLKIVAVTADATLEGKRQSVRAGMCAHLNKPFSLEELETLVESVLSES